jgi:PAS domain S-box-containing protein
MGNNCSNNIQKQNILHNDELFDLNIPLINTNDTGTIINANKAACDFFGYETMIGKHIEILMPRSITKNHAKYMKNYIDTGIPHVIGGPGREVQVVKSNSTLVPVLLTIARTSNGFTAAISSLKNVLEQRIREKKLIEEAAKKSVEEHTYFVSYLSHEIKVTLNAITLGIALLEEKQILELNDDKENTDDLIPLKQHCGDMRICCDNIVNLLNDVTDMEKMRSGFYKYKYSSANLSTLINKNIKIKTSKNILFSKILSPQLHLYTIWCDKHRILQVINNLMSNAIRHVNNNGTISLTVSLSIDQNHLIDDNEKFKFNAPSESKSIDVTIDIWNSGSTIPSGYEKTIFDPFITYGNIKRTGIGLSICKQIITNGHNGSIGAWSDKSGTTFSVKLSLFGMENQEETINNTILIDDDNTIRLTTENNNKNNIDVLYVEDDDMNRVIVGRMIKSKGIIMETCENGKNSIEWLEKGNKCKMILMDNIMSVMNGVEASKIITKKYPDLPIIGITGGEEDKIKELEDAGARHILVKPVFKDKLLRAIRKYL